MSQLDRISLIGLPCPRAARGAAPERENGQEFIIDACLQPEHASGRRDR